MKDLDLPFPDWGNDPWEKISAFGAVISHRYLYQGDGREVFNRILVQRYMERFEPEAYEAQNEVGTL